jgi:hypothetical protein
MTSNNTTDQTIEMRKEIVKFAQLWYAAKKCYDEWEAGDDPAGYPGEVTRETGALFEEELEEAAKNLYKAVDKLTKFRIKQAKAGR